MAVLGMRSFDPLESLFELQRNLDRFLQKPRGIDLGPSGPGVYPPINVFTDGNGIVIRAEVPGVPPNELGVSVQRGSLTISGERRPEAKTGGSYHRRERAFGKFSRTVQLPDELNFEAAQATCRNGILTVRLPTREETKPKQIKIQAS